MFLVAYLVTTEDHEKDYNFGLHWHKNDEIKQSMDDLIANGPDRSEIEYVKAEINIPAGNRIRIYLNIACLNKTGYRDIRNAAKEIDITGLYLEILTRKCLYALSCFRPNSDQLF